MVMYTYEAPGMHGQGACAPALCGGGSQCDAWDQKLGLPPGDSGFGYTAEQVATLPQFDMVDCLAYYEAVRRATLRYLAGLTPADLARCPHPERRPGYSIGRMLTHLIVE